MFSMDDISQIKIFTFSIVRPTKFTQIEPSSPKVLSAKFFRIMLVSPAKEDDVETANPDCTEGILIKLRFAKQNKSNLYF